MKIKNIMLLTLLLLAVLTIGAVNAADDIASDNMTVMMSTSIISILMRTKYPSIRMITTPLQISTCQVRQKVMSKYLQIERTL